MPDAVIGEWTHDQFVAKVLEFHGHAAPGVLIGGYMVEAARRALPRDILFDAVVESVQCLPDAVQLLTPCTVGNGWLRVRNLGIFALSLFNKYTGEGIRARLDVERLEKFPAVRAWFLKLAPKKEQDSEGIAREIRESGMEMITTMPVQIHPDTLKHKGKGAIVRCPSCGEHYPAVFGATCRLCQGNGPYENWARKA